MLALVLSARAGAADGAVITPSEASAQHVAEAEALAERAYAAYVARDYAVAVALYHQAFERAPSADALFNIARIYDLGLRDRTLAMSFYRRYLSDPGALPERIERATLRLSELRVAERAELAARPEHTPAPLASATRLEANADDNRDGLSGWRVAAVALGTTGAIATGIGVILRRRRRCCRTPIAPTPTAMTTTAARGRASTPRGPPHVTRRWPRGASRRARDCWRPGALLWVLDPNGAAPRSDARVEPIASASELGLALAGSW